ncbi:MAG TPA: MarR family transcriptional regulator, partial [Microbacterium sp.]|nr:MarR family transcriptional regulator [Microbacterium sp.]
EQTGLVARVPSTQDERGVNVTLSPMGASVLERVLPGHVEVVRDVLVDALDGADRDELTRLLGRIVQHMRSRPPRSARRSTAGGAEA